MPAGIDPIGDQPEAATRRLPRARGDRPQQRTLEGQGFVASPCPRGSTRRVCRAVRSWPGFPVPAGIDPRRASKAGSIEGLPRARGDRPPLAGAAYTYDAASPCPRGSTQPELSDEDEAGGFPVPAGIDPLAWDAAAFSSWLPRARGDRPWCTITFAEKPPASPCPRGSTPRATPPNHGLPGFPVPAGIDPDRLPPECGRQRLPRARGDRPVALFWRGNGDAASPCPRGSTLTIYSSARSTRGFPVPAGIDPSGFAVASGMGMASPCPRGSTRSADSVRSSAPGFPVPAGIDPIPASGMSPSNRLPRARGDRPLTVAGDVSRETASPCPRGSTRLQSPADRAAAGFPVPAGIDPRFVATALGQIGLPRARGDRPTYAPMEPVRERASPCPRGSTPLSLLPGSPGAGFPVPAGIDPTPAVLPRAGRRLPRARGDRPVWSGSRT